MKIIFLFLIAFFSALILTPLLRRLARRWKILDYVNAKRKIHTKPMPLLGGASIFISFYLALILCKINIFAPLARGLILGSGIIFIIGLLTDIRELSAQTRLLVQVLAALAVMSSGNVLSFLPNNFWGIGGEWILTLIWIVGITNALNCLDGLDGLAAGFCAISAACFFIIAIMSRQPQVGFISIALIGSCLGFLVYNFNPASIFLGDAGSTLIGFILANIAIMGDWATDNVVGLSVPLLILGVPIFDMVFTTVMRVNNRQISDVFEWMTYGGKDHFHHRLVDLGLNQRGAVLFIYSVEVLLGLSAIVVLRSTGINALLLLCQAALIFILISVLMIIGKRRRSGWNLKPD